MSLAVARIVFTPCVRAMIATQFVLSIALAARLVTITRVSSFGAELALMRMKTWLIPDGFGCGSTAVPVRTIRLVVEMKPLCGEVTLTTGALVSGNPPGAMRRFNVPVLLVLTLAMAIL